MFSLGIPSEELWGRNTGVFVGLTTSDAHEGWGSNPEDPNGYAAWGCCKNMFANRISYNFNFRGKPLNLWQINSSGGAQFSDNMSRGY